MLRPLLRLFIGVLAALTAIAGLVIVCLYLLFWSSLPKLDGLHHSKSIQNSITIDRDELGVPTIAGISRNDISFGLGFCHGQERFFQMDLQRRMAAGELSALVGQATLEQDKILRLHNFRERAQLIYENLLKEEQETLDHYTLGVNEGLKSLTTRPPEYWMLGSTPSSWQPEDTLLVIFGFYLDLQSNPDLDYARWVARQTLPQEVVDFLDTPTHAWEAAIDGSQFLSNKIPGPEAFRYLSKTISDPLDFEIPDNAERHPGSNNWVVGGNLSVTGAPLIASDPHLSLGVPNTWYKTSYSYFPKGKEKKIEVHGFTIPGLPGIVIGSNGSFAWGITNSSLDVDDLILLEPGPNGFPEYLTPNGIAQIQTRREVIAIKGKEAVVVEYPYSQWGPVIGETPNGLKRVRRWTAYHPEAANVRSLMVEQFESVQEFLDKSHEKNLPIQNYVLADIEGNFAWTLAGFIPDRNGRDPFEATYSSKAEHVWTEKLRKEHWPTWVNPDSQRIWTANNRVFGDELYRQLGHGNFSEFPRALQIREQLFAQDKHSPRSMAAIQHDNAISFLSRWHTLLIETLDSTQEFRPEFARMRQEIESWNGRADPDSIGYSLIRDFRKRITVEVLRHITQPAREFDPANFNPYRFKTEEAMYQIVAQQPEYLLNPSYRTWQEQLDYVLLELAKHIQSRGWESFRWGERNQSDFYHPITQGVPWLASLLNMKKTELDGDHYCPKVLSHSLAAGVRMVVSPGKLEDGIFQMGCGQSGHPLSPHYRDLHESWSSSDYLPFLPGETIHSLTIQPTR